MLLISVNSSSLENIDYNLNVLTHKQCYYSQLSNRFNLSNRMPLPFTAS